MSHRRISIAVASLVALAALALASSAADADKKKRRKKGPSHRAETQGVTYATPLKEQPGEASKTLVELKVGDEVEVIGRKGRWVRVRVRVSRKLGWVTRTTIGPRDGTGTPAGPGKKTGDAWGGDSIGVDGARKGTKSEAIDESAVRRVEPQDRPSQAGDEVAGPNRSRMHMDRRGLELSAGAALGLSTYSRQLSSNGDSALGGYRITAGTMAASASGLARMHVGDLFVAARASYVTHVGAPGIRFQDEEGGVSDPSGFQVHRIGASLELGATLGESHPVRIAAVGGYQLGYFFVSDIQDNPGLLASEKLAGPRIGVSASTGISREILVSANFSWSPSVSLAQTVNLEDGMESDVWAISGGARASYLLDDRHTIDVGYAGRRITYRFSGQSTRQFDVTQARRKDVYHALMVGVARAF